MSRNQILLGSDNQRFQSISYNPKPNEQIIEDNKLKSGDLQQKVQAHFNSGIQDIQLDGEIINEFQFYRKYNEKFNQQFNDMFENQQFSVYQKDLLQAPNEKDDVYQFLIPTETLNPLLHKIETENKMLKVELNYIGCDLKKFIAMVEILLDENKFIREHINQKNRDIAKLIESISVNESEDVHDLKHKIHIINEENNILLRHLQEMKKYKDQYDNLAQNSDAEIQSSKDLISNLKDDLENAFKREENLTKQLAILEPKYSKETDKTVQLEANLEECSLRLNNYQNEILTLKNENGLYKRTYEEQNKKLKQEVETLNYQVAKFQQQYNNHIEGQIEIKKQNDLLRTENQNLLKELEESRNDQLPIQQYLEEFKNQLQIERQKVDHSAQIEKGLKQKLDNSTNQMDKLNLKLQQLENQYNNLLNSSKFDLQEKHNKYEEILKNLQFSFKQQLEEKEDEIIVISQQLNQQKQSIDKTTQELEFKTRLLNDLKTQQIDNQENKRKIESLELQNKLQAKEINELNSIVTNYKLQVERQVNFQRENDELIKQLKKYENQVHQLQNQVVQESQQNYDTQIIIQSNEALKLQKENLEIRNENLKKEVEQLRQELTDYVNSNIDLRVIQQKKIQVDNEQLQVQNKLMQQQINQMTFANLQNVGQNIEDDVQNEQINNEISPQNKYQPYQQKQTSQQLQNQKTKINKYDWINYQQK